MVFTKPARALVFFIGVPGDALVQYPHEPTDARELFAPFSDQVFDDIKLGLGLKGVGEVSMSQNSTFE